MKKILAFVAVIGLSIVYTQTGRQNAPHMAIQQASALPCEAPSSCSPRPKVNLAGLFF